MSQAPGCIGCRGLHRMQRLYKRVFERYDKSGKQVPYGWSCPDCGAVRVDEAPDLEHWIYRGKYS